jgi:Domain of unknown function (DUF6265)
MSLRVLHWLTVILIGGSAPPTGDFFEPPRVSDLAWLEGVWQGRIGTRDFEARYTGPEGGLILSVSKYSVNGRAAGFEFERFEEKDGHVVLTPYPDGKASPATFRLTDYDQKSRRAVFENPKHDFPTKISYQLVADDSLTILVSGPGKGGKENVIRYELKRAGG